MSLVLALWIFIPLVAVIAGLVFFARERRSTTDFAQVQAFKAALPWWVRTIEHLLALVCGSLLAVAAWKICVRLVGPPARGPITSPGAIYVVLGVGAIILPLALLCANLASWIVPPLRSANQRAFRANGLSFSTLNTGLIKFGFASVLFGLLLIGIAAVGPWAGP